LRCIKPDQHQLGDYRDWLGNDHSCVENPNSIVTVGTTEPVAHMGDTLLYELRQETLRLATILSKTHKTHPYEFDVEESSGNIMATRTIQP
jgi:hypothetical protein